MENSQGKGGDLRIKSPQLYPASPSVNQGTSDPALHTRTGNRSENRSSASALRGAETGPTGLCHQCEHAIERALPVSTVLVHGPNCANDRPAPVNLADAGDHCSRCHRPLNVNEPLYRGPSGSVICAACNDAAPDRAASAANARAFKVEIGGLRTSTLLRQVANDLRAGAMPGALRDRANILADELDSRAERIALELNAAMLPTPEVQAAFRRIGEVRS
jgi:hypothetical protein